MSAEESLNNAENLLARLEAARARLDETQDADQAIEILQELAEVAKQVEAELQRALPLEVVLHDSVGTLYRVRAVNP